MELETVIFTCATFFDFENQDKWNSFCFGIDSILEKHTQDDLNKINKFIIVNEYSKKPKRDWIATVREKYPFIEVIQKTKENSGQTCSLNIILEKIKKYTYWIHWEDSWYCKNSCLNRMFDVMHNTNITQLQCTQSKGKTHWVESDSHYHHLNKTINGTEFYEIYPSDGTYKYLHEQASNFDNSYLGQSIGKWPLYSLTPSINRVSRYNFGDFSNNLDPVWLSRELDDEITDRPKHWPFRFEWDFGRRWLLAGNTKAVLPDGPIMRDEENHIHTWSK